MDPVYLEQIVARRPDVMANARKTAAQIEEVFAPHQAGFDRRLNVIQTQGSSRKKRLRDFLSFVSDVRAIAAPFTPCKKGCGGCCYQQVVISQLEADHIGERYGHPVTRVLTRAKRGSIGEFGRHTPCTFLVNGCCSVYEARPFVCRNQLALDVDALLCQPENIELMAQKHPLATNVPMMTGGRMTEVYRDLVAQDVLADIRAFFPPGTDSQVV